MYMSCRICCSMTSAGVPPPEGQLAREALPGGTPQATPHPRLLTAGSLRVSLVCGASPLCLSSQPGTNASPLPRTATGTRQQEAKRQPGPGKGWGAGIRSKLVLLLAHQLPHPSSACVLASPGARGQWGGSKPPALQGNVRSRPCLGRQVSSDLLVEGNDDTSRIDDTAQASQELIAPPQVRGGRSAY